jgi:hypothetical protein
MGEVSALGQGAHPGAPLQDRSLSYFYERIFVLMEAMEGMREGTQDRHFSFTMA